MNIESSDNQIPFSPGDWLIDKNNPGQPEQYIRIVLNGSMTKKKAVQ